jgi:BirA family biotin operon repressor/biotin-[acetyl-CoA-carboxylase] ligase
MVTDLRGPDLELDLELLDKRLEAAVAAGLLSSGTAHRVGMAARLTSRLADTYAGGGGKTGVAPISGQALAGMMGLSRAAVHKHVRHLRALGFAVTSAPGKGYRLDSPFADLVAAEAVLPFLLGTAHAALPAPGPLPVGLPPVGLPYIYLEQCGSTNLVIREAMALRGEATGPPAVGRTPSRRGASGPPTGTVVVTDEQTAGRGRLSRTWSSRPGADLTFSVLLRPALAPGEAHLFSLAAGLTVAEVLETLPGFEGKATVKWPNDVLLGDKKVCGILLEGSMDAESLHWVVVGVGLNVNSLSSTLMTASTPEEATAWVGRPRPVSLWEHVGRETPRAPLLAVMLERLGRRWAALEGGSSARAEVLEQLQRRDALAGRLVEVAKATGPPESTVTGEAVGLGPEGQLLVRRASGEMLEVFAGDVTVRSFAEARSGAEGRAGL